MPAKKSEKLLVFILLLAFSACQYEELKDKSPVVLELIYPCRQRSCPAKRLKRSTVAALCKVILGSLIRALLDALRLLLIICGDIEENPGPDVTTMTETADYLKKEMKLLFEDSLNYLYRLVALALGIDYQGLLKLLTILEDHLTSVPANTYILLEERITSRLETLLDVMFGSPDEGIRKICHQKKTSNAYFLSAS